MCGLLTRSSIWLHAALMDLLRPFTSRSAQGDCAFTTFSAEGSSAGAAYKASVNQLKRLVLEYRTTHESSAYSILWHTGLLYLVNAMLETPQDPDWHFYFLVCIYGYEALSRPYRISGSIGKGLLAMTLRDTDMTGREARHILAEIERDEVTGTDDNIRATFMGDLTLAMRDPDRASVEHLAKEFEFLALFNEVVDGRDFN
jgi:hypothetical protein